jgi:hypothetical protein
MQLGRLQEGRLVTVDRRWAKSEFAPAQLEFVRVDDHKRFVFLVDVDFLFDRDGEPLHAYVVLDGDEVLRHVRLGGRPRYAQQE